MATKLDQCPQRGRLLKVSFYLVVPHRRHLPVSMGTIESWVIAGMIRGQQKWFRSVGRGAASLRMLASIVRPLTLHNGQEMGPCFRREPGVFRSPGVARLPSPWMGEGYGGLPACWLGRVG